MNRLQPLTIGSCRVDMPVLLAPMAGVSDLAFRLLCREMGAGLVCTEMVSVKAIFYGNRGTKELMESRPEERPLALQLFGSDPELMGEIAAQVEDGPWDILDVNMGCPVPKVVKNGDGSALLKDPGKIEKIVSAMTKAVKKPVTVKIRKGFELEDECAVEAALAPDTAGDLYRILLTGETAEGGAGAAALREALADRFDTLEVRDRTRMAEDLWQRAGEDSLRGLFLRELLARREAAKDEAARAEIDLAARFGLAALDHRDLG